MQKTTIDFTAAAVERLQQAVGGDVIVPDDARYDEARSVYFSGIDRRPAAVVRPVDADDIAAVLEVARGSGLTLSIRSGGHSPAGYGVCDDGIVIDLSSMRGLEIDAGARTAWVETGMTTGQFTRATGEHGLVTGFGDAPSVGVGGITLAGGIGYLHRLHGMTIDNLLAAEIVTADGSLHRIDAQREAELFWAIRGGGGNFGVVTRLHFRLREIGTVLGGMLILPASPETIVASVEAAMAAPDELSGILNVTIAPPMPFLPPEVHGRPIIMAMLVHATGGEAGERAFAPFRALAPLADMVRPMPYATMYDDAEHAPHPVAVTIRPLFVDSVDRSAAEAILDGLHASAAPMKAVQYRVLGGAVARVAKDATAFAHRTRGAMVNVAAMYDEPAQAPQHDAWADRLAADLEQGEPGAYVGFLTAVPPERVRAAYPPATWDRLRTVKAEVDPDNLFRMNQNIRQPG